MSKIDKFVPLCVEHSIKHFSQLKDRIEELSEEKIGLHRRLSEEKRDNELHLENNFHLARQLEQLKNKIDEAIEYLISKENSLILTSGARKELLAILKGE